MWGAVPLHHFSLSYLLSTLMTWYIVASPLTSRHDLNRHHASHVPVLVESIFVSKLNYHANSKTRRGPDSADHTPSQRETPQGSIRHVGLQLASRSSLLRDTGRVGVLGGALEYVPQPDSPSQYANRTSAIQEPHTLLRSPPNE